jgi:hypothetical protein
MDLDYGSRPDVHLAGHQGDDGDNEKQKNKKYLEL